MALDKAYREINAKLDAILAALQIDPVTLESTASKPAKPAPSTTPTKAK